MMPYLLLLSESQERMLLVVRAGREAEVQAAFEHYGLHAVAIGRVIEDPVVRATFHGEVACELPGRALTDDAPRYVPPAGQPSRLAALRTERLDDLAAELPDANALLALLSAPNLSSRKPIWRRYDHMNGTSTVVGPGAGDAALLRIKGTPRAIALSLDGPGRLGALDPRLAGAAAVLEGALNVACSGARPIGMTNCLNFGSPEEPDGYWQLVEAVDGMADACRALDIPIVSGNVSLYNQAPEGRILPTPVVGRVGLLEDRSGAVRLGWQADRQVWLLGEHAFVADALAASELAWRRGRFGGTPRLDIAAAARLVSLLPRLAERRLLDAAHDLSVGGLGVALARMAIAGGVGARVHLADEEAATVAPTAVLFGERGGRVVVTVEAENAAALADACMAAGVAARQLGITGGGLVDIAARTWEISIPLERLASAWETPF
jgi:phosphoribosylformylglycinamidine synthase